jgi:aminopeptidase-like protein
MTFTDLSALFDRLFPICRSITGPGLRESLEIFKEHMPLTIHGVPTGEKVLDWTVPQEWAVESARLTGPDGEVVCDFANHNLHLVNYSVAHSATLSLTELQPHLHSLPHLPDVIPYVTSYYVPRWGFCLPHRQRQNLPEGNYCVSIKTRHYDGETNFATAILPGESDEVVLISSYLCHPSMANNELSGPLGLLRLYELLAARKTRRFTYMFLLCPETLGSIAFLSKYAATLGPKLHAGLVLTCLGGPKSALSLKLSRRDWLDRPSAFDTLARTLATTIPDRYTVRPFTPTSGSDERQFCSPGFDWPVIQAARTVYGQFAEYHSSGDDRKFMRIEQVEAAALQLASFLETAEFQGIGLVNRHPFGEPQLGKRDLYPSINSPMNRDHSSDNAVDRRETLNRLLMLLSLSDGTRDLVECARKIGCSPDALLPIVRELFAKGMLETRELTNGAFE